METIFTFDWQNVYPKVIEGIQNGTITLRDGVAYWTTLAEKSGIAQHMPLKEIVFDPNAINELKELVEILHATQMVALGVSTGIIVGAIVLQTAYLSKKLDRLQQTVDLISQDINSQNVLFFMEKMSEYFGVVESARVLMLDKKLVPETADVATVLLTQMSIQRNELMSLIDNLISYADEATETHLQQMLDFITMMLDIVPKAIYIESQLCDRYGKFKLAQHLMSENTKRYNKTLQYYRDWCNTKVKNIIRGEIDPEALAFHDKKDDLKELFNSKNNQDLLQQLIEPKLELVN